MESFPSEQRSWERSTGPSRPVFDVRRQSGACPGAGPLLHPSEVKQCRRMCIDASQTRTAAVDGSVAPHRAALCSHSPAFPPGTSKAPFSRSLSIPFFIFLKLILRGAKGHYTFKAGNGSGLFRDDNLQLQINNRILLLGRNARIQNNIIG